MDYLSVCCDVFLLSRNMMAIDSQYDGWKGVNMHSNQYSVVTCVYNAVSGYLDGRYYLLLLPYLLLLLLSLPNVSVELGSFVFSLWLLLSGNQE